MYKNVHQIPTYMQKMYKLYKNCTKFRLKTAWNLKCMFFCTYKQCTNYTNPIQHAKPLYVFCTYKSFTNYVKSIQLADWNDLCTFFVHSSNVQTMKNPYN